MPFAYPAVFLFGLLIGSFLNVCIYRLPRDRSIVSPPSSCPACGAGIKPYHNVPVISYLWLRGRCASCGARISARYPAIELLNALAYVAALYRFGPGAGAFVVMAVLSAFIVVTFIDLEHQIIPDEITLPGIALGLVLGPVVFKTGIINSVLGVLAGGGLFYLIAVVSKGGMGGGDIKLMAMIGAFFGWKPALVTIFFGSLLGAVVGIGLMLFRGMHRKTPIPFGPFLVAGAVITIFRGGELLEWYGGLRFFQ
ncbi:MAG TPA: A24 family peptidase [Nitrospirota bacterium]|nr:A24 family peptidase [Nitrospirota bacterium]